MKYDELLTMVTKQSGKTPTQIELAKILGLTRGAIASRASRNAKYSYDEVIKIQEHYGIDLINESNTDEKEIAVDYYPDVFGSCEGGRFVLSETKEKMQVPRSIIKDYRKFKKYSVINAVGDSMTPYIQDKDFLIVEHYNNEQIKDNRVYVFRFGDSIFVKRLVFNIDELIVKSDNKEYKEKIIEKDDLNEVQIIGQIVGLMRRTR